MITRLVWVAFAISVAVDAVTFFCESATTVADHEMNALARYLGPGLPGSIGTKMIACTLLGIGILLLRRSGIVPRQAETLIIALFALVGFYAAYTNVVFGRIA